MRIIKKKVIKNKILGKDSFEDTITERGDLDNLKICSHRASTSHSRTSVIKFDASTVNSLALVEAIGSVEELLQ